MTQPRPWPWTDSQCRSSGRLENGPYKRLPIGRLVRPSRVAFRSKDAAGDRPNEYLGIQKCGGASEHPTDRGRQRRLYPRRGRVGRLKPAVLGTDFVAQDVPQLLAGVLALGGACRGPAVSVNIHPVVLKVCPLAGGDSEKQKRRPGRSS